MKDVKSELGACSALHLKLEAQVTKKHEDRTDKHGQAHMQSVLADGKFSPSFPTFLKKQNKEKLLLPKSQTLTPDLDPPEPI